MRRIISALTLLVAAMVAFAAEPIELVDNPPDRHVVVPGDTLWGIAGQFLKEPWRWPEIWRMNKEEIRNPHRIFPGDIVYLDRSGAEPRLLLAKPVGGPEKLQPKVYSQPVRTEITSIPAEIIEPFITRPLVIEPGEFDRSPRVIASQDERVVMGSGDRIYVMGMDEMETTRKWSLYRPGDMLRDPETKEVLGVEAVFLGTALLVEPGDPAVMTLTNSREEVVAGDRLVPVKEMGLDAYVPHKPDLEIAGRIISLHGGVGEGGRFSIVSLNRGELDGVEKGHVLALYRSRQARVREDNGRIRMVDLPEARFGLMFVFRTFDRVSYALVMESSGSLVPGDVFRNP